MLTLDVASNCKNQNDLINRALRVAQYYGFVHFDDAPTGGTNVLGPRSGKIDQRDISFVHRDERTLLSAVKTCAIKGLGDRRQPALLWRLMRGANPETAVLELHALGIPDAVAESLMIGVTNAIATDVGIEKRVVNINSMGSFESSARFVRDLTTFLKKYATDLPPHMRGMILEDPISSLLYIAEKGHPLLHRAPVSMDYLNEEERKRFWDVLEHLEFAGTFYELSPFVLGSRDCWSHTLFELSYVSPESKRVPFARGGRYDQLCSRGAGPGASAVSVSITLGGKVPQKIKSKGPNPSVYFAHIGREAKRRAIATLEILRTAGIPVHQSLMHEQLGPQMEHAKKLRVPWLLVMGHKEAMAGSLLVRDTFMNAQEEVFLPDLAGYLKRRRIGVA